MDTLPSIYLENTARWVITSQYAVLGFWLFLILLLYAAEVILAQKIIKIKKQVKEIKSSDLDA